MPEKILRAVASPPMMFWAPQLPAMINMAMHGMGMVFGWGLFRISPLIMIVSFIVFHLLIASQGARNPHLSTLIPAFSVGKRPTSNLIRNGTKKYVP